ncbi:MAG: leucine--tRNA ligase [Candidatus Taylorbacteria bacterium]|nr:leucine--tRNA ligase [Candidatus Taylorbacteria bacterium]
MNQYDHTKIEKKWQKTWDKSGIYKTKDNETVKVNGKLRQKPKAYILDMFPYPSGAGLHVGHPRGYIATDVYSRFKKMQGFNILHPMGWDAFGLPAEEFAIKNKVHPAIATKKNVQRYKEQLSILGLNYDWSREVNTTDPEYYKWTQWAFLQMHKKGLTFESHEPINWCPSCKTGLANEDLEDGKCERCGSIVEKKPIRQWVIKITKYADRLLKDLDALNWPESIKESQRNWIGRSEGAEVVFTIEGSSSTAKIFTTRIDTLFGVTYIVIAPESPLVNDLESKIKNIDEVKTYIQEVKTKSDIERTAEGKEKTGVELQGVYAINPATNEKIPVWIADYVLSGYGTGVVMAVPGHDARDFQFAKKFNLQIKRVVAGLDDETLPMLSEGSLINSGEFNGQTTDAARDTIAKKYGKKVVNYKLRDWVFSRQRYWGEPIPLVHCEKCGVVPVPEKELPLKLPNVKSYEPTGTGESPLAAIEKWVNTKCPECKGKAKRETNTMPQWAGSCWYYLRYIDPKNKKALVDPKKEKYWQPVDMYVGGTEHATRHLIYARFWHKFLYDIGVVSTKEPFKELKNQGLIGGPDGRKMSKRYGNVVNPDDIVKLYGADTLRVYEMFMGPFDAGIAWSTDNIIGSRRFVEKIWRLRDKVVLPVKKTDTEPQLSEENESLLHKTIKKVTEDVQGFALNTAISSLMILVNGLEKEEKISKTTYETVLRIFAPFAPYMTEELWSSLKNKKSIHLETWPEFNPKKLVTSTFKIVVQINSKVRAQFETKSDTEADVVGAALQLPEIVAKLQGKNPLRHFYVKGKLINFVVKGI